MSGTSISSKINPFHGGDGIFILLSLFHKHTTLHHLKQIHSVLVTSGLSHNSFFLDQLVTTIAASQPTHLAYASVLVDRIEAPVTHLWNSIIRAFSASSEPRRSLLFYSKMRTTGVAPDKHTFPLLLKSFSKLKNENPFQFYAHIVKFGLSSDQFVKNSLISVFSGCGCLESACQVFDESTQKDVISWTALIDGYVKNDQAVEAMKCFMEMRLMGIRVDEVTIVSVLCAAGMAGDIWFGRWLHGFYVETGRVQWDVYIGSALLDMYMKCGYHDDARKVFKELPIKNVVSWSALIAGYVQCKRYKDALLGLKYMLSEHVKPNQFTLTSVLTCCADLGALDQGRSVHGYIYRHKIQVNSLLGTALVDMYAKCGCLGEGLSVFQKLPTKDVFAWTAVISGLAMGGNALDALNFFSRMLQSAVLPNEVTFIAVLSACSHGGLVDKGCKLFESMNEVFHLEPNVDHYGCMVDLLGRAGYLEEARKVIEDMPMVPSAGVWGALLGACMIHKNFKLGELVGNHLINLQSDHSGRYVLLANLYSTWNKWEAASGIRKLMKGKRVEKITGCSWIEVNGAVFEFTAFDESHSESDDIYVMLDNMFFQLKRAGYVPDANLFGFDID
ncbi:pentatricopeptide repeat-containing protein At1g50270 [Pyrus communis]|uniref:pentatricopeptide repeat-containing protein At1g50270 n=1 Tax=Pyrus communis TaxID=23211 RepID=UPI0035BFFF4F